MIFPVKLFSERAEMTESFGRELASELQKNISLPRFVAMYGDLGVGKTAFVRGFCSEICPSSTVKSPTFALVNDYRATVAVGGIKRVYHFDMYRIADEDDLYSIGFYDYLRDDILCIAEWCELIPYALPEEFVKVSIEKIGFENDRRIIASIEKP
jgi:tRNA threonylcarbamoyladenosine biosynthesis protein TsaE